ncbi:hypothetical protein V1514DRAFT_328783 [Lipomyces japonicus]|uniref:uncharacterized protein n=1 Tax=Lipomyces japonicus TaxID=56871 RepID=UPI0034CFE7CE
MIFGPALYPMLWVLAKTLWSEYQKRPPLWFSYEPEPFPEVSYVPGVCDVYRPDVFTGCEDIKVYGDYAIVSCDPYKKQSNFLTGYKAGTPSGAVYIWNYVADSEPVQIEFGDDFGELRPQGVRGIFTNEHETTLRIFVTNAAGKGNASVEVFDFTPSTGKIDRFLSLPHGKAILDPVSVVPISATQVFTANTLGYPYRGVLSYLEALSGMPFGTIGYLDFTNVSNITEKSVGASTTPIGIEYHGDKLYVASAQYGIYSYQLYIPPDDITDEQVAENKSLGRMHFYPGEEIFRTPYLPLHLSYSTELDGLVSAGANSVLGQVLSWLSSKKRKAASWAGLLVQLGDLVVADSVTSALKDKDRKWQTVFWDKTGDKFSGLNSLVVENGRRFGVSLHDQGVLICNTNGLEEVIVPEQEDLEQEIDKKNNDKLEHLYLKSEL